MAAPHRWFGAGAVDISANGRFVVFSSAATNLVPHDTNYFCMADGDMVFDDNCPDIFAFDRQTGTTERLSVGSSGAEIGAGAVLPRSAVTDDSLPSLPVAIPDCGGGSNERCA